MNIFITILEAVFDDYFQRKYPGENLTSPSPLTQEKYRKELEAFFGFLIKEYTSAELGMKYWEDRSGK